MVYCNRSSAFHLLRFELTIISVELRHRKANNGQCSKLWHVMLVSWVEFDSCYMFDKHGLGLFVDADSKYHAGA